MWGSTAWVQAIGPRRLMTRTWTVPHCATTFATMPATAAASAMSTRHAAAAPPSFSIARATSAPPASFRSAIATRAPSRASAFAMARPIPLAAPVTIATRSRSFTGPPGGKSSRPVTPRGLHGLPVHRALRGAREGVGERHRVGPLEPGDLRRHEVAHLRGGVPAGLHLDHRLDGLAPPGVRDAVHAHAAHAGELHDHGLDLRRVDVLPAGLDQLFLRLALDVIEVAVGVEAPHVPGVVPAVAEGVRRHIRLAEVALEHERATHDDLPRRPDGHLSIVIVHELHLADGHGLAGGAGLVPHALQGDEPAGFRLSEAGPELRPGLRVQALDGLGRVEAGDVLQAGNRLPSFSAASSRLVSTG